MVWGKVRMKTSARMAAIGTGGIINKHGGAPGHISLKTKG